MAVTIEDNGTKIKITSEAEARSIIKARIREIEVIKTNILKIDLGRGALENIFIPFAEVSSPLKENPEALRDTLLGFLENSGGSGAKESKQDQQIELLNNLKSSILTTQELVASIDNKNFFQPLLVDNNAGVIYRGYAAIGTETKAALWAIERISSHKGLETHSWADGNRNFDNVWDDREKLIYK